MANTSTWLSISTMSGSSGQTILTVNAAPNLTSSAKTAVVKAYNPVYNISATTQVTIAQYSPSIEVSPTMVGVPDTGGTYQLSISANCSYFITYPELVTNYSTTAATGDTTITFRVPSTSADTTLVGNIVITDTSGQVSKLVRIEQYGAGAHISYSPSAITIPYSGGAATFSVTADCIYNITKGSGDWYTVIPQTGYTGVTVFTVSSNTANTGATDWTSSITIVGPNGNVGTVAVTQSKMPVVVQIPYTADTSTVDASGETRVITIDTTGLVPSSITVDIEGASGATYTYDNGIITVTFPENTGTERDITVIVNGQTTGGDDAAAVITFPQAEYTTIQIPYTADTSTVDASGETRFIYIDTTGLIESSITISVEGATGITYSYSNGVITVIFPRNRSGNVKNIAINVSAKDINRNNAIATVLYSQDSGEIYLIPYTADTSTVDETGETRYIYIDTTGLIESSITVSSSGIPNVTTFYSNGVVTVIFPNNSGNEEEILEGSVIIEGETINGNYAFAIVDYEQFTVDILTVPLTFKIRNNGQIVWKRLGVSGNPSKTISYKKNNDEWVEITSDISSYAPKIDVVAGDKIRFKGVNDSYANANGYNWFSEGPSYDVYGNIMSLIYGDNFIGRTILPEAAYNFTHLFGGGVVSAKNLILPANSLTIYCYESMFAGCTGLKSAPVLSATILAENCCSYMFSGCTSLTLPPALSATTLANNCYEFMFSGCRSLTAAPELPATALTNSCYYGMFQDCTSLTQAPVLPATTLEESCYFLMFSGCTSLSQAPALPAMTMVDDCYHSMFYECTSLTAAPDLLAPVLANDCYNSMFFSCTTLNYIKCFAVDKSASLCTHYWVSYVAPSGTFVKEASATWTVNENGIPCGWTIETGTTPTPSAAPLTFEILSGGTIKWSAGSTGVMKTIQYKKNDDSWITITSNTGNSAPTISVVSGDIVQFRGNNNNALNGNYFSGSTCIYNLSGNIMSLIDSINYENIDTLTSANIFAYLFRDCTGLTNANNLFLPATTLTDNCYANMFSGCTNLISTPTLPATTLATGCYQNMFGNCTSLVIPPVLPATILTENCYRTMFSGCTSLTTIPVLTATTLGKYCYESMFAGCTSLITNLSSVGNSDTVLVTGCCQNMFSGCTSLSQAPALPATTLANYCYQNMFINCTSLTAAPVLSATILTEGCYRTMFSGCTSLTQAPVLPATTLANNCYRSMFYGCRNLNYIKCLATNPSSSYTSAWVNGVSATGTFIKDSSTTWSTGNSGIPSGWTVQDA